MRLWEDEEEEEEEQTFRIFLGIDVFTLAAHYHVGFCCYVTNFSLFKMYVIVVNDDQQYAYILAYLFIPDQLYTFRAMYSPTIRST